MPTLTERAQLLEDADLRGALLDVKLNASTGAIRVVLLKLEYEIIATPTR